MLSIRAQHALIARFEKWSLFGPSREVTARELLGLDLSKPYRASEFRHIRNFGAKTYREIVEAQALCARIVEQHSGGGWDCKLGCVGRECCSV